MKRQNLIEELHLRERLTPMMQTLEMMRNEIGDALVGPVERMDPDWDRISTGLRRAIKELRRVLAPVKVRKAEVAIASEALRGESMLADTLDRVILALVDNPDWQDSDDLDDGWDECEGRYSEPGRAA